MTATEKLRKLLDERGVEYVLNDEYAEKYPPENEVTWSSDLAGEDMTVTARDYCISKDEDGRLEYCLDLEFHEVFTPEQAVAATLGRGECTDTGRYCFTCSECGWTANEPHHALGGFWPDYCPNCGRKVVDE